jgi:hypothetical protein
MKKALVYGTVLIAIYLGVANATGAGTLLNDTFTGGAGFVRTLQGRN